MMVESVTALLDGIPNIREDNGDGVLITSALTNLEAVRALLSSSLVLNQVCGVSQLLWTRVVSESYCFLPSSECHGTLAIKYRRCVLEISVFCCTHGDGSQRDTVWDKCRTALSKCSSTSEKMPAGGHGGLLNSQELDIFFPIYLAVEVSEKVLSQEEQAKFRACVADALVIALCNCSQPVLTFLVSLLLPIVYSVASPGIAGWCEGIWSSLRDGDNAADRCSSDSEFSWRNRSLIIVCSIIDRLLHRSVVASFDIRREPKFWDLIADGLSLTDALCRKQASHLLRNCLASLHRSKCDIPEAGGVFWWQSCDDKYVDAWHDFQLVLTTLEETQGHILRPVLPRIHKLITACEENVLHFSWVAVVFERLFRHELAFLGTWGVRVCLESTSLRRGPFAEPRTWQFLLGPFLQALLSTDLYSREHGVVEKELPLVAANLQSFMSELVDSLPRDRKALFLRTFLERLSELSLTSVPMMYIWKALAAIPDCPVWAEAELYTIGHVVLKAFRTHEVLIRAATQCFMLKSIVHLSDPDSVSLNCVGQMLSAFSGTESLVHGSDIWTEVAAWLRRVSAAALCSKSALKAGTATNCLELLQEWLRTVIASKLEAAASAPSDGDGQVTSDVLSVPAIMRLVALAASSLAVDRSVDEATHWLAGVLLPLERTLNGMDGHTYLCQQRASTALEMLQAVLDYVNVEHSADGNLCRAVCGLLHTVGSSVVAFLQQKMLSVADHDNISVVSIQRMHNLLTSIFNISQDPVQQSIYSNLSSVHAMCYRSHLITDCMTSLKACLSAGLREESCTMSLALQQLSSLRLLAWLCSVHLGRDGTRRPTSTAEAADAPFAELCAFVVRLADEQVVPQRPTVESAAQMNKDWGRFGAECVESLWHALLAVVAHALARSEVTDGSGASAFPVVAVTGAAVSALSVLAGRACLPVLAALKMLLPQAVQADGDLAVAVISACWMVLREQRDHVVYRAVITTVYLPILLSADVPEQVTERMRRFTAQVADMADLCIGMHTIVAEQCCSHWLRMLQGSTRDQDAAARSLALHSDLWISIISYGPQRTKNIRLENTASRFVENLGGQCSANLLSSRRSRDDRLVRVYGISVLAALSESSPAHVDLAEQLMRALVTYDQSLNNAKMKYSFRSPSHNKKQRLWQALLLMSSLLSREACEYLADYIYSALSSEHQPSVKYVCQWTLVLLLHWHPSLWPSYWSKFQEIKSHRVPAMCSLLCVSVHMARLLGPTAQQTFIADALPLIMPWCQSQHNTVRAYALACVDALWTTCKQAGLAELLERFSIIESCVHFSKCNWESMRAKQRVCDDFFFATLRPSLDYSVETIFHTVPALTHLVEEEWIPVDIFQSAWPRDLLESRASSGWWTVANRVDYTSLLEKKQAEFDVDGGERPEAAGAGQAVGSGPSEPSAANLDVQQKITRLENFLPSASDELRFYQQLRDERRNDRGNLVLVTSLLEKIPNVGGLCRTCEIFGVSRLVVSSKNVLDDKRFSALSVTAEKWIPIQEVKATAVGDYVRYMRDECGYGIVGVEQTACSRSLEHYQFKQKTLLLLGNEREGIPADLIQLMDECVEIPQLGVIRSLNVHVSGAILVWEYTKQRIVSAAALASSAIEPS